MISRNLRSSPRSTIGKTAVFLLAAAAVTLTNFRGHAASCTPPPSGLIGWWAGDGNALDSASTNNGTLMGGATATAAAMVGQGFTFDGTNGYVQIPDAPVLHPTNLTIEAWVRFTSLNSAGSGGSPAGDQYIVFKQNTRSGDFEGFDLSKTRDPGGDVFRFLVTSASAQLAEIHSATVLATGVWYHVAAVRGSNFTQLYVNGQLERQTNVGFAQNYGALPLYFGTSGQSYWDHKLNGNLDEVSLYNRALSASEIAAIYSAGAAGKCKSSGGLAITVPPQSQNVAVDSNAVFTVAASGTAPLSYQWRFNGADLAGATNTSLTLTAVQLANAGNYLAVVTNSSAAVTSSVAVLTVVVPPGITVQPLSLTNVTGTSAAFSVTATGTAPLSYQWRLNGTPLANSARITGATSSALAISALQVADAGNYTVTVSNFAGVVTSAVATLTILAPPTISGQPASQTVVAGANASLFVAVSGTPPFGFQWLKNGLTLTDGGGVSGSSSSVLTFTGAQTNNAGNYQVIITNAVGSITSAVATLTVTVPGSCLTAPSGLVGWWTGDGTANDQLGIDNAILVGGAGVSAPGVVGNAFSFDGTNSYVQIADATLLHPTNLTIEAWVRFTGLDSAGSGGSPAGDQYIVFKQNTRSGDFEGFDLSKTRIGGNDVFRFLVTSATAQTAEIDSKTPLVAGSWYHVAAVRGPNFTQLYVNGKLEAQGTVAFAQDYGALPLYFGTSGQSYWDHKLKGNLDEVSLYNRALSSNEVAAIYAIGTGGKCKGGVPPTIVGQPANQTYAAGATASFSVTAIGTSPLAYQWFKDGFRLVDGARLSGSTNAGLSVLSEQSTDIGNYQVVVTNFAGAVTSLVASLSTGVPPTNDAFAAGAVITGSSGSVAGNNASATKEAGEPNHAGNPGGASVWYVWTAPSTSPVTFDTALSAFDTLLAVYTGNSVGGLTLIASNDNISTNNIKSRLTFTPVAGTVYHIAVDGANGANGNLTLRWAQATTPLPDLSIVGSAVNPVISTETFLPTSCAVVEGLIQAGVRRIIRFDTETENSGTADLFFGNPAANPLFVWAPCHAHYHFQNYMSYRLRDASGKIAAVGLKVGFCILDVFRWSPSSSGTAKYSCTNQGIQTGWGDLYDSTLDGQWIDITGLPDGAYTIEIEANPQGIIQESNYANNITQVPIIIGNSSAPPLNDNFASPQAILGSFSSVLGLTTNATKEAGEPNHAGNAGGHSVWYQWTALDTKPVTLDTLGSSFNTLLAVYTGTSVSALSLVASNDDISAGTNLQSRLTFPATSGVVYNIAADGFNGASGNLVLTLNQTIQNDNFAACQFIGGVSGTVYGSNAGATKEAGEPNHAGNPGGASVWYCWTAPINGMVTFDTVGSTFNTLLAAYSGTTVNALTVLASNDDITPGSNLQSSISFSATGLTQYHIAIDGFNGDSGDSRLNWSLVPTGSAVPVQGVVYDKSGSPVFDPPSVLSYSFLAGGEFQLDISGLPQQQYRIERSCDLVHWLPLAPTVADFTGHAMFIDKASPHVQTGLGDPVCGSGQVVGSASASGISRFYRAVLVPVH